MFRINKIQIIGTLAKALDLSTFKSVGSLPLANISIAVSVPKKTPQGDRDEISFFDVTAWGKTVDILRQNSEKGNVFYIEGKLKQETWQDKNTGSTRSKVVIVASDIQLVEKSNEPPSIDPAALFQPPTQYANADNGNGWCPPSNSEPPF